MNPRKITNKVARFRRSQGWAVFLGVFFGVTAWSVLVVLLAVLFI